jgi:hypothetical protein
MLAGHVLLAGLAMGPPDLVAARAVAVVDNRLPVLVSIVIWRTSQTQAVIIGEGGPAKTDQSHHRDQH